jgi:hypothetical protein
MTQREQGQNSRRTAEEKKNIDAYQEELKILREQRTRDTVILDEARKGLKEAEEAVDRANTETLKPSQNISLNDIKQFVEINNQPPERR